MKLKNSDEEEMEKNKFSELKFDIASVQTKIVKRV